MKMPNPRKGISRSRLLATVTSAMAMSLSATGHAGAQEQDPAARELEEIIVTGSRIVRQDYVANSPITTVTGAQIVANADITLESYLNTLPQVNPAATSTSNNPSNNGQANIDLRGFGANRNLVLIDGRRPMVSDNRLTVDVNTIPAALIERVEVITGGAGATYGADAVAGAVNFILKNDFEGASVRAGWSDSTEHWDAREYSVSAVVGGNFDGGKGNAVLAIDKSEREALIKGQRDFAKVATSTTGSPPEGNLRINSRNEIPLSALRAVFAGYGVAGDKIALAGGYGFNNDGTLFYNGVFNSPLDVQNFRGPIDDSVNANYFPDFYSYNFDAVNILTMPLNRDSVTGKFTYEFDSGIEVFGNVGWTEYRSASALAPTPTGSGTVRPPNNVTSSTQVISGLVTPGSEFTGGLLIPVTNPFIPADLRTLLNARRGDDPRLVGSGANEPFFIGSRLVAGGIRLENYENTVVQGTAGLRGPLFNSGWTWEVSASEGRAEIDNQQQGNVNNQRLFDLLAAADGGASLCEGGYNPFGDNPVSADCIRYLQVNTNTVTELKQQILQGFVAGDLFTLPAGAVSGVVGLEYRGFEYDFDPGATSGPIVGFNNGSRDKGSNRFRDVFAEAFLPLVKDSTWAQSLDLVVGWRRSDAEFNDQVQNIKQDLDAAHAFKAELNWAVDEELRLRGSFQRSVRAPNFNELFAGGSSFPQAFDPCSVSSDARKGADAGKLRELCLSTGVGTGSIDSFIATPGNQVSTTFDGNRDLQPEEADTYTLGLVYAPASDSPWLSGLVATLDYWNISVSDPILFISTNDLIGGCYNYHGANPTYDPNNFICKGIVRSGNNLFFINDPSTTSGNFELVNGGKQQSAGIDLQVDYSLDLESIGLGSAGTIRANAILSYLIEWNQKVADWAPTLNYAGTIGYFGAGLGQSFPEWKGTANLAWIWSDFTTSVRARYVGGMQNRASIEFPGETAFTGVDAVWYFDASLDIDITEELSLTVGLNNVFDRKPERYAPNVQSGTDPSTYDVVGRRVFASVNVKF